MHLKRPIARYVPRAERWYPLEGRSLHPIGEPARTWIELPSSLTARLTTHLQCDIRVRVLSERHDRFIASERELLGTAARSGRVREVQLEANGVPYVVARTVFSTETARGTHGALLHLGTRALGSLLFGAMRAPATVRQYARLTPVSSLWRALHTHLPDSADRLWARRALHSLQGHPLLVTEIFLPRLLGESDPS